MLLEVGFISRITLSSSSASINSARDPLRKHDELSLTCPTLKTRTTLSYFEAMLCQQVDIELNVVFEYIRKYRL